MLTDADREETSEGSPRILKGKVIAERIGRCPSDHLWAALWITSQHVASCQSKTRPTSTTIALRHSAAETNRDGSMCAASKFSCVRV